jgi:hypothetical protein
MRVYSETLPFDVIAGAIPLLRRFELELVVAVRPWDEPALPQLAAALRDGGVSFSIWPMLADDVGRWVSVYNAREFVDFTLRLCDVAQPRDVLFDLEPPLARVRPLVRMGGGHATPRTRLEAQRSTFADASEVLARAIGELHARRIATSMAVWPLVALDRAGRPGWQRLLGTPIDGVPAQHVSVMM